jgi:glutathione S-transferase
MPDIVLHHFNASPYAEKIRLILGHKNMAWKSVLVPNIMPKPLYTALTGGYRRVPVMQIGADVYCDTALIADEIERRFPAQPIMASGTAGWNQPIINWHDNYLFWKVARYVIGKNADAISDDFLRDRAKMMRRDLTPGANRAKGVAEAPYILSQLHIALGWLDDALAETGFVSGNQFSYADFALIPSLWFLTTRVSDAPALVESRFPHLADWLKRVSAVGSGSREEISGEAALAIALASMPEAQTSDATKSDEATGISVGDKVAVTPESFGTEAVSGVVAAISPQRVRLRWNGPEVGDVAIHFPRLGYVISKI